MIGKTLQEWRDAYRNGADPQKLLGELRASQNTNDPAWISLADAALLRTQLEALKQKSTELPLYGIPFAVKDNIDVAGLQTTAACREFAYAPKETAAAVQRLIDAGAIVIGKTNLDQFATGLVGTRSPYGAVPNVFDARYISGGSSSGSASVVARGIVPFALGTDTAGSGRVPAGFNNIVGLKPTRGALSARGVVPACRSLDCVSIFALTASDARTVYEHAVGFDAADAYSRAAGRTAALPRRPRFGIPASPDWYGDAEMQREYEKTLANMLAFGAELIPLDFAPLHQVAALLYEGPWVAERYAAIETFITKHADVMNPVVRQIIERAKNLNAVDTFKAMYRLGELKRQADALMSKVDALLVPTAPTIYTTADIDADPVRLNARLGTYTNFVNLLDWSAFAMPATIRDDGLPFGVTLIAPAWQELALADFAARWQTHIALPLGNTGCPPPQGTDIPAAPTGKNIVRLAVVGAHLTGMPLNRELTERGAVFVERTTTSAAYRLYALNGTVPPKPGLARGGNGAPIEVELWDVPTEHIGSFIAGIPSPLGIGTLELADGRSVKGFICEPWAIANATDITRFGGWRAYLASNTK
jgi:allophanate hydrolase